MESKKDKRSAHKERTVYMSVVSVPGKKNDELSYVFAEPEIQNGSGSVSLFAIFQSQNTSAVYQTFIEQTVRNYLDFYHATPKVIDSFLENESVNGFEFLFENSLQYTNEQLSTALLNFKGEGVRSGSLDLAKVHFILGAIMDGNLYLCNHGRQIKAYLLYPLRGANPSTPYSMVDILESAASQASDEHGRLFSSIITGKISIPQSKLVVCNQSFLDYVSQEQIKHSLTNQKTESLRHYYETLLSRANARNDFSAIFIDPWNFSQNPREAHNETVSHSSIEHLLNKQKGTSTVLTPGIGKNIVQVAGLIAKTLLQGGAVVFKSALSYAKSISVRRIKQNSVRGSVQTVRGTLLSFFYSAKKGAKWTIAMLQTTALPTVKKLIGRLLNFLVFLINTKYKPLPPNSKALLIVAMLFAVLFIQSLFTIAHRRSVAKSQAHQREILMDIEQKLNLAEASIIYEGDDKTKDLLAQIQQTVSSVKAQQLETSELSKTFSHLQERYDSIQAKISRSITIADPEIISSLEEKIPSPQSLRFVGSTKPILITSDDSIYAVDRKGGNVAQVNSQTKLTTIPCAAQFAESLMYICSGTNRLFAYNPKTDNLSSAPFPDEGRVLTDIKVFNKRLYSLDGTRGIVARHDRKGAGFGPGSVWIRDGSDIQGAKQIMIDGNVYILRNAATIDVYNAGNRVKTVALPTLANPISDITRFWTTDETDNLYLADSAEARILVIDKRTGSYVLSVTSPMFQQGIQDVMSTKSELFILSSGKLLRIPTDKIKL